MNQAVMIEAAVRSILLAMTVAFGLWALRIRGAQARHMAWTLVLLAALAMPFLPAVLRELLPEPAAAQVTAVVPVPQSMATVLYTPAASGQIVTPQASNTQRADYVLWAYLLVSGFLFLRLLVGVLLTWRIAARATETTTPGVRVSEELRAPVTFARTILLPANSGSWSSEMLESVLRHEGAHCERGDFYVQLAARVYRAAFWFNPLAWWLNRQLADLAEQACDDAAIRSREDCPAYAELLVTFASKSQLATEAAVAMARLSSVGRRVERLLDSAFEPGGKLTSASKWKVVGAMTPLVLAAAIGSVVLEAQQTKKTQQPAQPSKPAAPPKPSHRSSTTTHYSSDREGSIVILEDGDNLIVHGSSSDADTARKFRAASGGRLIWFRRDGKEYIVTDPATIEAAKALFRDQDELGRMQAVLGERQAELGKKQAELGELQARVTVDMPDLTREMKQLEAKLQKLARNKASVDELGDLQGQLGALQGKLGDLQGGAGQRQAELGAKQAQLGEQQAKLGAEQAMLGERQAEVSRKALETLAQRVPEWIRDGKAKPAVE